MSPRDPHEAEPDTPATRERHRREALAHAARKSTTTDDAGQPGGDEKE